MRSSSRFAVHSGTAPPAPCSRCLTMATPGGVLWNPGPLNGASGAAGQEPPA